MYRKIIVGYDGSPGSEDAVALGKLLAEATGASLTLAGVYYFSRRLGGRDPVLHDVEAAHIQQLEERAAAVGGEAHTLSSSSPARGLHQLAEDTGADLVLVGSAHRGKAGQILAGSVGTSLLHGSPCSVGIAPKGFAERTTGGLTHVVVGTDGSPEANMALTEAIELARAMGATLKLVTVAEPGVIVHAKGSGPKYSWPTMKEEIKELLRGKLDEAVDSVPDEIGVEATLREGQAEDVLAEIARAEGGLLLVGSRGYGPLRSVLLGSVSTALVRSAPCPLIVHPRPAKTTEPAAEPGKATTAG